MYLQNMYCHSTQAQVNSPLLWVTSRKLSNWPWVIFSPLALFTLSSLWLLSRSLSGSARMSCGRLTPSVWLGVSASISQPSGTRVPLFPRHSDVLAPLHCSLCFTQLQREIWGRATWYSSLSLSLFSKLRLSLSLRLSVAAMLTPAISSLCHSFLLSWTACYHHLSLFFFTVSPLTPVPLSLLLLILVSVS